MHLSVADVARLFSVTESTVSRWIRRDGMPARRVHDCLRLNRAEVIGWAATRGVAPVPEAFPPAERGGTRPSLTEALRAGGVHHRPGGSDRREALCAAVGTLPVREPAEREALLAVLLARESLGSTGIGDGIALPHARNPIVLPHCPPAVSLCFLESPVDFRAVDGKPVHTLFLVTCRSVRAHLHLLSRLTYALRDAGVRSALARREAGNRILEAFARVEEGMPSPAGSAPE